jgi:hypothetical protein
MPDLDLIKQENREDEGARKADRCALLVGGQDRNQRVLLAADSLQKQQMWWRRFSKWL